MTGDVLEPWLRDNYGEWWREVADDLDNAIAEWGGFVERKITQRIDDYITSVHETDDERRYQHSKQKHAGRFRGTKITREQLEHMWEESFVYYVKGIVRRYLGDPSGKYEQLVWEKPATGDPQIDADWSTDDVVIRGVGAQKAVRNVTVRRG